MYSIDLNCDLGEGTGNDPFIMPLISSCSIACGGHFGDKKTITEMVQSSPLTIQLVFLFTGRYLFSPEKSVNEA